MKKIFRKAMTVFGSAVLVGATVGAAAAASTDAFVGNSAIVVGANADADDFTAAKNIASAINSVSAGDSAMNLVGGDTVTEDEVPLGEDIIYGKIDATITDSDLPSLIDGKISWDDGTGSSEIDVHEEIVITANKMQVNTSLTDEDFKGVALTNEMGLEYKYVFDDNDLNASAIGNDDADTLYLTILGKEYEVSGLTNETITVVTSEEISLSVGESVTVDGKTFTVDDVFDGKAQINGEVISQGDTEKVDGIQVNVDTVGYHTNAPELSKVILRIGEDISKTYSDGDEYIGEDEDDPLWVWDISNTITSQMVQAGSYIGVKYNVNINDADDEEAGDSIKYVGEGYMLPDNFAQVTLDGTTDVDYEEIKVGFKKKDLYNSTTGGLMNESKDVIVISAPTTDSITVADGADSDTSDEQTDEIYVYLAPKSEGLVGDSVGANGSVQVYYRDHDGDFTPTGKARYETGVDLSDATNSTDAWQVATIEVGDTTVNVTIAVTGGDSANLTFTPDAGEAVILNLEGTTWKYLGASDDDADANDIIVGTTDVSTKDKSIMTNYGMIVAEDDPDGVEGNANDDEVILSVPDERVYAIVSVTAGGSPSDSGEAGIMIYKDTETSSFANKNLIVVGGSAINSVAAELLGGAYSDAEFTAQTGVGAGSFLIESFERESAPGKTAVLVAGYNAEDTTKAANAFLNSDVDTTVGMKYVSSATTVSDTDLVTA